jgi:hypothetical protein
LFKWQDFNPHKFPVNAAQMSNLATLASCINKGLTKCPLKLIITSGLRDLERHKAIYLKKGIEESKIPLGSKHLSGQAVDMADKDGSLWLWCIANMKDLEAANLYLEDKSATPTWVHFQCVPPKSGKRIFKP